MKFANPNQFEKMRKEEEGLRNPEDIWDVEVLEDIKREIKEAPSNTNELLEEGELGVESKKCLEKIRTFCHEVSQEYKEEFLSLLERYEKERHLISPKIMDYLLKKRFDLPQFIISHGERANELLSDFGFEAKIDDSNLLLVFQLPKPLAQFWWKGDIGSQGEMSEKIDNAAIEWGRFYRELMPIIWEAQGRHENENDLDFYRINKLGEHDPKKYYYVWEISDWEN